MRLDAARQRVHDVAALQARDDAPATQAPRLTALGYGEPIIINPQVEAADQSGRGC